MSQVPPLRPEIQSPHDLAAMALKNAAAQLVAAKRNYHAAIVAARGLGMSNAKIGSIVGKTEAAVRMHIKRREAREG